MKHLKNHHYVLITHIVMSSVFLLYDYSLISLISILSSLLYLILIKTIRKSKMVNYFIQLGLFCLIPFCYTTDNLVKNYLNTDWGSIITLLIIMVAFCMALKIPNIRKESFLNVRNRYTEDDSEIRKKTNVFVSKTLYVSLVPQFILTLFFTWKEKLVITFIILFLVIIIGRMYSSYIGRKKMAKQQQANA